MTAAPERKPLPAASTPRDLWRLRPPQLPGRDHAYFDGSEHCPFEPRPRGFSLGNAWWLAEASLLAYVRDARAVEAELRRAGFEDVRCLGFERRASTECVVAARPGAVVVAFRGTEAREGIDWATDLDARPVPFAPGGRVHAGFLRALDHRDAAARVAGAIAELGRGREVHFTGHSLGGALASLAAARHGDRCHLVTFGAPRAGDAAFARALPEDSHRVVNGRDAVPLLPPFPPFADAGRGWRIEGDEVKPIARRRPIPKNPLGPFADHLPTFYALRLWNAWVAAGTP